MSRPLDATTSWASARTGITVTYAPALAGVGERVSAGVGLGLRRNPKRAQLLVSTVLGKHVPVVASVCLSAGDSLGREVKRVAAGLGYGTAQLDVIGFAETATGLGHQVAAALPGCRYIHTTRRPGAGARLEFLEEHSHATEQWLTPPADWLREGVAVLVDDELSTGRTAMNAVATVGAIGYRHVILASLLDTRSATHRDSCAMRADELGIVLADAAVLTGTVTVPAHAAQRAAELIAGAAAPANA